MKSSNKAKLFAAAALFLIASVSLCLLVSCGGNEPKPNGSQQESEDITKEDNKDASINESSIEESSIEESSIEESSTEESSTEESSSADDDTADGTFWVLETYREYLKSKYYIESAPYLRIERYVGTFGDGCIVAYMRGDGIDFTDAERTETYGSHTITFPSGRICYAFYNNEVLTIGQAYERGILSDDDILVIDAEVGTYGQTPGRFDWVLETYREYLKSKYYIESAPYLRFQHYVGTFGDGCVVAYMCGVDITYADESRTETYGSHTITFPSGQICYAFYNNEVLTIGQAYERGILSDDDILIINAAVGMFVQ